MRVATAWRRMMSGSDRTRPYEANVKWRRQPHERFTDNHYSRAHEWSFDGGAKVHASASPHVVRLPFSDPTGVDPEEAFVAALASCHMLFFLSFAARDGFVVATYDDRAVGIMGKTADGRQWMTTVTLRPHVVFDGASGRLPQRSRRSTMPRTRPATLRIPSGPRSWSKVKPTAFADTAHARP